MTRLIINDKAKKAADQFTSQELWDRYKAAKLMDDKEEVRIFRKAIELNKTSPATQYSI